MAYFRDAAHCQYTKLLRKFTLIKSLSSIKKKNLNAILIKTKFKSVALFILIIYYNCLFR